MLRTPDHRVSLRRPNARPRSNAPWIRKGKHHPDTSFVRRITSRLGGGRITPTRIDQGSRRISTPRAIDNIQSRGHSAPIEADLRRPVSPREVKRGPSAWKNYHSESLETDSRILNDYLV